MQNINSVNFTNSYFNLRKRWLLTASALILVFAGPPILANFLYQQREHFQFKTMNTGELQTEAKSIEAYGLSNEQFQGHWQLLYIAPTSCDAACQKQKELLRNIQISLGKDQHRLLLRSVPIDLSTTLTANSAWIVDPQGFMIMYYSQDILEQHPKGLLEDIRRLVRFSHANTR